MESLSTRRETGSHSIEQPPRMSSSSDLMTERLLCSICLEVFSDPVSTPCGHNFCKICLNTHWNNSQDYRCPNCNKAFKQRPDLKINTTLRDLVDEHKKKSHETQPEAEVVCDICTEGKLKAVKSCLVCQISYCETHLESHLRVSGLQKHKLIDPVKNLQDYICQKHDRPLELFCRDDHTCVCVICSVKEHKNHNTVPIRESDLQEMMENQTAAQKHNEDVNKDLKKEISEQELMIENQKAAEKQDEDVIKDLKEEITELKKRNIELEMVKQKQITPERRNDVIKDLKEEITELEKRNTELEMVKQKQITPERRNDVIKDLKEEITELKKRNIEQQQKISNTEDNLLLIQEEHQKDLSRQQQSSSERSFKFWFLVVGVLFVFSACFIQTYNHIQRREAETLEKLEFSKSEITELKKRNNELDLDMQRREAETLERLETSKTEITELKKRNNELNLDMQLCKAELKLMQQNAVDVTLDPDTASSELILYDDEKQVHDLPDNPKRFDTCPNVLEKEGFVSWIYYNLYGFLVVGLILFVCLLIVLRCVNP